VLGRHGRCSSAARASARGLVLLWGTGMLLLLGAPTAQAHPLDTTAVFLDVAADRVVATVQLPLEPLGIARDATLTPDRVVRDDVLPGLRDYVSRHTALSGADDRTWPAELDGGEVVEVDERPHLALRATFTRPAGAAPAGELTFTYDAVTERLISHRVFVVGRAGGAGEYQDLGLISWQGQNVAVPADLAVASAGRRLLDAVWLGFTHIGEGSDHVLFLVMLLVTAPLIARDRRWMPGLPLRPALGRAAGVVTAFSLGHSLTLVLGALGLVSAPTRLVESVIAASVLFAALHAARPVFGSVEVLLAGGFGLLHGLAFADVLAELQLSSTGLLISLLGFNLGVELVQLTVVALVLPSLLLLSRGTAHEVIRLALAGGAAFVAAGWLLERADVIGSNPLAPAADVLTEHPVWAVTGFALLAVLTTARRGETVTDAPGEDDHRHALT
jgi:hypothetical protein